MSDKSTPRELWMACGCGDVAKVTSQLATGDKIDAREPNVRPTAFVAAAASCSRLTRGVSSCAQSQGTALYFASLNGHLEVVKLLLENQADVNLANKSGQTPLHVAQTPEVAEALIEADCDTDAKNKVRARPCPANPACQRASVPAGSNGARRLPAVG